MSFLTPTQYAKTSAAKGGSSYNQYRTWVTKTRATRAAARSGTTIKTSNSTPYGVYSPAQLLGMAQKLYGSPNVGFNQGLQSQATNFAHNLVDPVIRGINSDYASRASSGAAAIKAITDQYASMLGGVKDQVGDIYGAAQSKVSALNDALSGAVTDHGGLAQSFQNSLANAGQDTTAATNFAALANNAGAVEQANNISAAQSLVQQGAANQSYAAMLPGFARQSGINNLGSFASQIESERSSAVNDLNSKLPGIISDLYGNISGQSDARRKAIGDFVTNGLDNDQQAYQFAKTLGLDTSKFNADQTQFWARLGLSQDQLDATIAANNAKTTKPFNAGQAYRESLPSLYDLIHPPLTGDPKGPRGTIKNWSKAYQKLAQFLGQSYPDANKGWVDMTVRQFLRAQGVAPQPGKGLPDRPVQGGSGVPPDARSGGGLAPGQTPKPEHHPNATWHPTGPKGPGWYEPHKVSGSRGGSTNILVKVG